MREGPCPSAYFHSLTQHRALSTECVSGSVCVCVCVYVFNKANTIYALTVAYSI